MVFSFVKASDGRAKVGFLNGEWIVRREAGGWRGCKVWVKCKGWGCKGHARNVQGGRGTWCGFVHDLLSSILERESSFRIADDVR